MRAAHPYPINNDEHHKLIRECRRLRAHLFDGALGLPALPMVIEDARRLIESQGPVAVVAIEIGQGFHFHDADCAPPRRVVAAQPESCRA